MFEDVLKRALIMLQATSALDSISERLVQGALDRLMKVHAISLLHFYQQTKYLFLKYTVETLSLYSAEVVV
jgi:ABC-type transport system involved in Fe-S cluster assembly fused permease/ATPase subunit